MRSRAQLLSDRALGESLIDQAHELAERGEVNAAAVVLALAGAVMEGPEAQSALVALVAEFCTMRPTTHTEAPPTQAPDRCN